MEHQKHGTWCSSFLIQTILLWEIGQAHGEIVSWPWRMKWRLMVLSEQQQHCFLLICQYHRLEWCVRNYGSCLLWVMSTEILVDIAVDIAIDTRLIVSRHSVDSRPTLSRQSVDTRSTLGRQSVDIAVDSRSIVGRHSVETRSIVVPDVSRPI